MSGQTQQQQPAASAQPAAALQNPVAPPSESAESSEAEVYPSIPREYFNDDLEPLQGPMHDSEDSREDYKEAYMSTLKMPGLLGNHHFNEKPDRLRERARITQALQLSNSYRTEQDPPVEKLSRSNERKSLVARGFSLIDSIFIRFQVLHDDNGYVAAARPDPSRFQEVSENLLSLQKKATNELLGQGKVIPDLPKWGSSNNYQQWRTINDFEIFATAYRQDADDFMHLIGPYLPAGSGIPKMPASPATALPVTAPSVSAFSRPSIINSNLPPPHTPIRISSDPDYGASVSERPARIQSTRFHLPDTPLRERAVASSSYLGSILGQDASTVDPLFSRDRPPHMPESDGINPGGDEDEGTGSAPSIAGSNRGGAPGAPDDDPSGSDSDSGRGGRRPGPPRPPRSLRRPFSSASPFTSSASKLPHFDQKLKIETVPQWDGDEDKLVRWIDKVNSLSEMSPEVHTALGAIVPRRLTNEAKTWYYSITPSQRKLFKVSWSTLREAIASFWMNNQWLERQKIHANLARFRETGHGRETPTAFVIRKLELIRTVYNFNDTECIQMVMREVPVSWGPIVQPHLCKNLFDFRSVIKYHKSNLIDASIGYGASSSTSRPPYSSPNRSNYQQARVNLVSWSKNMPAPEFPKDDHNVSTPRTPESVGTRPCQHCGSGMHWDKECKHSRQGEKRVWANLAQYDRDDLTAQEEYDDLYYASNAEDF